MFITTWLHFAISVVLFNCPCIYLFFEFIWWVSKKGLIALIDGTEFDNNITMTKRLPSLFSLMSALSLTQLLPMRWYFLFVILSYVSLTLLLKSARSPFSESYIFSVSRPWRYSLYRVLWCLCLMFTDKTSIKYVICYMLVVYFL